MKKIIIPKDLKGKELFKFLIENKEAIIAQKKEFPKKCDAFSSEISTYHVKGDTIVKVMPGETMDPTEDTGTIRVKIVGNAAWWCDSHMDVLVEDCWKKTIKDRKKLIKHLRDHVYELEAEIGDVVNLYSQDISLTELGLRNGEGTTQCLLMDSDVKREYNEKVYKKYRAGKINQHSIGLRYVHIELAINDDESEKEYDFWKKYFKHVINKEVVEERGYFWVVTEILLLEISAVLFGSNELTPTLEAKGDTEEEPSTKDTSIQPPTAPKGMNWGLLANKILN